MYGRISRVRNIEWRRRCTIICTQQQGNTIPWREHVTSSRRKINGGWTYCSEQQLRFVIDSVSLNAVHRNISHFHGTDTFQDKKTSKLAHNSDILCTPCAQNCHLHKPVKHRYLVEVTLETKPINHLMISMKSSRTRNYPEEISIIGIHNDETFTTKSDTIFTTLHLILH